MSDFTLHPQLEKDTGFIADWPLSRILRMKDAQYPWLILVPRRNEMREIIDLALEDQQHLFSEITKLSELLRIHCQPTKLNIGALGNMVPQLHIHVIARFDKDAAWPKPIWGTLPALPFGEQDWQEELQIWRHRLAGAFLK